MCGTSRASARRSSAHTSPEKVVELGGAAIWVRSASAERRETGMGRGGLWMRDGFLLFCDVATGDLVKSYP
jgi:hypothetical protein